MLGSLVEEITRTKRTFRDAAENGDLKKLVTLYSAQKKKDIESRSDYGATALHKAAANGHLGCVQFLLGHGAEPVQALGEGCLEGGEVRGRAGTEEDGGSPGVVPRGVDGEVGEADDDNAGALSSSTHWRGVAARASETST